VNTPIKAYTSVLALLINVGVVGVPVSLADDDDGDPPRTVGRTLLNRQNGTTRTGLSGVKSQPARPISRLGGVKAQLPRPIGNRGSLLPPRENVHSSPLPPRVGGSRGPVTDADGRGPRGQTNGPDGVAFGFDSQNGFSAAGQFSDDSSNIRFRVYPGGVGSVYNPRQRHGHDHDGNDHHHHNRPSYPYYPSYYPWGFGWYYDNYRTSYDYYPPQTITTTPIYIDASMLGAQNQAQTAPPPPPTGVELADVAMYEGRYDKAIAGYRVHLTTAPDDTEAMRRLAIALILDKKVKEGVAVLGAAYEKDLSLVRKPLDMNMIPDGQDQFRDMLYQVAPFANSMRSASGYLTVAVIMQAQGREDMARKNMKKARDAGLPDKVATEFETELGG
jgi:hypothetical protein